MERFSSTPSNPSASILFIRSRPVRRSERSMSSLNGDRFVYTRIYGVTPPVPLSRRSGAFTLVAVFGPAAAQMRFRARRQ